MNPLELRKVILRHMVFDAPDGAPLLDAQGYPVNPVDHPTVLTVIFWVPQKAPFRRCAGDTQALDARPFELQALADGAIAETVVEVRCPRMPADTELSGLLIPIWEELTVKALGYLPNKPPEDHDPKHAVQFVAI